MQHAGQHVFNAKNGEKPRFSMWTERSWRGLWALCVVLLGLAGCPEPAPGARDGGAGTADAGYGEPVDAGRVDAGHGDAGPADGGRVDAGPAGCVHACEAGDALCSPGGLRTCETGADGCRAFGAPMVCPEGQVCSGGACTDACTDLCTEGEARCSGDQQQTCTRLPSGCLDWGAPAACDMGVCTGNGVCALSCEDMCNAGDAECTDAGRRVCAVVGGCTAWRDVACAAGEMCTDGVCEAVPCETPCPETYGPDTDSADTHTCEAGVCIGPLDGVVLNEVGHTVSGTIHVDGAPLMRDETFCAEHPGYALVRVRFVDAAKGYDASRLIRCQDPDFTWSLRLPPGTYRVTVEPEGWAYDAGLNLVWQDVVVREALVVDGDQNDVVLNEVGHIVSGTIHVDGAPLTRDEAFCGMHPGYALVRVRFVDAAKGYDASRLLRCQDPDFTWSLRMPPGTYRVTVEPEGWAYDAGLNLVWQDVVVREALVLDSDQNDVVLNEVGHTVSGTIHVDGAPLTRNEAFCAEHPGYALVRVRFMDAAKGYEASRLIRCQDPDFTWSLRMPPGTYRVTVEPEGWAYDAGLNLVWQDVVVREALVVDGDQNDVVLNEVGHTVSGTIHVDGAPLTRDEAFCGMHPGYALVRVRFVDAAKGYDASRLIRCQDPDFTWSLRMPPGTYRVTVEPEGWAYDAGLNLVWQDVVVREALVLDSDQNDVVLNEVGHTVSGTIHVDGAPLMRDEAFCAEHPGYALVRVRFVDAAKGYDASRLIRCQDPDFTWSLRLPTGTYRVLVEPEGWAYDAGLNLVWQDVVVREALPVMADVSGLVLDEVGHAVSGTIHVDGAPLMRDEAFCAMHPGYALVRVRFVDAAKGYDASRLIRCQDPDFTWSLRLPTGTYRVLVEPEGWAYDAGLNLVWQDYVAVGALAVP